MELWVGIGNLTEISWVGIKEQTNRCDMVLGVCYRLLDLEEQVDEAFSRHLEVASHSQALVLIGDFNHTNICWRDNR